MILITDIKDEILKIITLQGDDGILQMNLIVEMYEKTDRVAFAYKAVRDLVHDGLITKEPVKIKDNTGMTTITNLLKVIKRPRSNYKKCKEMLF